MLEKAGKNSGDNRRDNRGLVLRMVATGACRTRRDLVVRTGLSKMTISNIVGEMIDGDVLRESEVVCSEEPGRNPVRLRLSPEAPKAAGVAFLPGDLIDLFLRGNSTPLNDHRNQLCREQVI